MTNTSSKAPRGRPRRSHSQLENSRRRILDAARSLFARDGYDGVSMRNIARLAECSPAALYTVFASKREVLRVIWEEVFNTLAEQLERIAEQTPAPQRVLALCEGMVDFWLAHPDDFRAIFLIEDRLQSAQDHYFVDSSAALTRLDVLRKAIAQAQAHGSIRSAAVDDVLNILLCSVQGLALNLITIPEYPWGDARALKHATLSALVRGLAPQ